MMKHKHHIIPRHAGGTDDPSNIVHLSVAEHAEAHHILYETYGNDEDRIAWQGLSGMISKEEIIKEVQRLSAKKQNEKIGNPWAGKRTRMNFAENTELQRKATEASKTKEVKEKRKATFKERGHAKGEKNSQYGRIWISNTISKEVKRLERNEEIPNGWVRGKTGHVVKKCWVNNGKNEHYVPLEKKQEYILNGFSSGRLKNSMPQNRIVV